MDLLLALVVFNVAWVAAERITQARGRHWYSLGDCRVVLWHVPRGRKVTKVERV